MTPPMLSLVLAALLAPVALLQTANPAVASAGRRPNVVLVITDDQGYGDVGIHGNAKLQTPNLDRLAREGVRFRSFYVSPVCSPTRASLLTGRYNYRTGVVDTYLGRSLMHSDEVTLAEILTAAGYRTGIFGKWHLGDNYPLRAMDQGFQESLTLNGGGIGQPSDPPGGESYFDPLLRRNGRWVKSRGYVSDVITDAAIDFMTRHRRRPFFTYVAFNAPHTPLEVPPEKHAKYTAMNLGPADFSAPGHPIAGKFDADATARVYGMVENVDDNIGRLLGTLEQLDIADNTLVIFLTDNGPQQPRFNAGMRRLKGTVNEGGIRVPLFVRWPAVLPAGREVDRIAAHIDVTPTILDLLKVATPSGLRVDGISLKPLLEGKLEGWPDRTIFFQWHRGDVPQRGRAYAVRSQQYKLIQAQGSGEGAAVPASPPELFDLAEDPLEQRDVAGERPQIAQRLGEAYDVWFQDVTRERDYTDDGIPRVAIGDGREEPVRLTRQDWRGPHAGWTPTSVGHWQVSIRRAGRYSLRVRFATLTEPGVLRLTVGATTVEQAVSAGATTATLVNVRLTRGPATLASDITTATQRVGPLDVMVSRTPRR